MRPAGIHARSGAARSGEKRIVISGATSDTLSWSTVRRSRVCTAEAGAGPAISSSRR
jgi:hypothetical protein